jgi:hypothetical protein
MVVMDIIGGLFQKVVGSVYKTHPNATALTT